jgi:type II secretory pathway component PulF
MPVYSYTAVDTKGARSEGTIDAVTTDIAVSSLQRRGLIVQTIDEHTNKTGFGTDISIFKRITNKDVVVLSRQMATLFEAQVSALRAFRLLATETDNPKLAEHLSEIANDIQSGLTISKSLAKHPKVFSNFYVEMVKTGEETGKLDTTFTFLAEYLDRMYEVSSRARNALIYPAFVIVVFFVVMILMLTFVIPKLSVILQETGQKLPVYTQAVIAISNFLTHYFYLFIAFLIAGGVVFGRALQTESVKESLAQVRMEVPYIGGLYQKLYLSRISDNLSTMIGSGIQMVRAIEMSASVVDDPVYSKALIAISRDVQTGVHASDSFAKYPQLFPGIMIAMMRVGEETGDAAKILETMSKFYRREVNGAVDTIVTLIEPFMIVFLALGVGTLLASVLVPIYQISAGL